MERSDAEQYTYPAHTPLKSVTIDASWKVGTLSANQRDFPFYVIKMGLIGLFVKSQHD